MKRLFIICIVLLTALCVSTAALSKGNDPQVESLKGYWKNILADQKKLNSIMKKIKKQDQLSAKKNTIIDLRNRIDSNAKYRRSIMKKIPEANNNRLKVARSLKKQYKSYEKNRKRFYKERKRIKKLPGCEAIVQDIDRRHKSNKTVLIGKLKREGKMWSKRVGKKKKGKKSKKGKWRRTRR
ncbi:MAG: hypothetical protein GY754_02355 [bacterium]|nr:hypothetical protein [bacterium]